MDLKYFFFALLLYLYYQINQCNSAKITYFSTERPVVNWYDTRYFKNFTLTSRRLRRQDPRYYVEVYIHPCMPLDNNLRLDFYFYQFLTNRYRRSFVELHFGFCDMIHSDVIFGPAVRNALGGQDCPFPPGHGIPWQASVLSDPYTFKKPPLVHSERAPYYIGLKHSEMWMYYYIHLWALPNPSGITSVMLYQGIYDLQNMTIPFVPKGFPFNKGRIYCNISLVEGGSTKLVAFGSIDMEVKVAKINI